MQQYASEMQSTTSRSYDDYTVGWICALPLEMAAAKLMLDRSHEGLPQSRPTDQNTYALGEIAGHNVVIACLPSGVYGTTSAAVVAEHMVSTFPNIQLPLMVGVGGGVPGRTSDIRLGDVVVSKPTGRHGGVLQYDHGKMLKEGKFHQTGTLNKPLHLLLTALSHLEANHLIGESQIPRLESDALEGNPVCQLRFSYPGQEQDRLFQSEYPHEEHGLNDDCSSCNHSQLVQRLPRSTQDPQVHYGLIASGNQVMKDGLTRDRWGRDFNILCFEMEAAGLMDHFSCLIVRGICDYADSHKNNNWQGYAALTAAAYAKELLRVVANSSGINTVKPLYRNIITHNDRMDPFSTTPAKVADPLSTLHVASKIVQFINFSAQFVSKTGRGRFPQVMQWGGGNTETATVRVKWLNRHVNDSLSSARMTLTPSHEAQQRYKRLQDICQRCDTASKTLLCHMHLLGVPEATEYSKWRSLRHALKKVWGKHEIDEFATSLYSLKEALESDVILPLRKSQGDNHENPLSMIDFDNEIVKLLGQMGNKEMGEPGQIPPSNISIEYTKRARVVCLQQDVKRRRGMIEHNLLESLRFLEIDHRFESVADPHLHTFKWILNDPVETQKPWDSFIKWLSTGSGAYWIQGKAASGKSTLMRYLWHHPQTWEFLGDWYQHSDCIGGIFFFWNSGAKEQRSQSGLFRTLLFKVLRQCRNLIPRVFPSFWNQRAQLAVRDNELPGPVWNLADLQKAFQNLISLARDDLKMVFFIDGLDEYDGDPDEIAGYVGKLSRVSSHAKFCVSSRPWPVFDDIFRSACKLRLQDLTKDDIDLYIQDNLVYNHYMQRLRDEDPINTDCLISEISAKADGVFLWVALVVRSLVKELRNGGDISNLRQLLAELPADLEKLYDHMLNGINPGYREESSKMIQIFRASGHLLDVPTLYLALHCSSADQVKHMQIESLYMTKEGPDEKERQRKMRRAIERTVTKLNSRCLGLLEVHSVPENLEISPYATGEGAFGNAPMIDTISDVTLLSRATGNYQPTINYRFPHPLPPSTEQCFDAGSSRKRRRRRRHRRENIQEGRGEGTACRIIPQESHSEPSASYKGRSQKLCQKCRIGEAPLGIAMEQQAPQYVGYLHRTVKDYLEGPTVWQKVIEMAQHSEFDPSTALIMARVVEAKLTSFILQHDCLFEIGLFTLHKLQGSEIQGSASQVELVEELDRVLTAHWNLRHRPQINEHWSLADCRWIDHSSRHLRIAWGTDILAMAMLAGLQWYLNAKKSAIPSPVFLARRQNLPLPYLATSEREGLPLLAIALGFDDWAVEGLTIPPDVEDIQFLLHEGANPNELYQHYTIWQYTIHYVHVIKSIPSKQPSLSQWLQAFILMLEHGADPYASCIRDVSAFSSAVCLPEKADTLPTLAEHTVPDFSFNLGSHKNISVYERNLTPKGLHQYNHSVTAVVHDAFQGIKGAGRLSRLLEEKKAQWNNAESNALEPKRKRKKNKTPNWVS